jgi:hypothetical protein
LCNAEDGDGSEGSKAKSASGFKEEIRLAGSRIHTPFTGGGAERKLARETNQPPAPSLARTAELRLHVVSQADCNSLFPLTSRKIAKTGS